MKETVDEQIAHIIMQAIAPYNEPYKKWGEKSIETAKNEIIQQTKKTEYRIVTGKQKEGLSDAA